MGGKGSREARKRAHAAWISKKKAEGWTQKTLWVPPGKQAIIADERLEDAQARIEALERELAKAREWQEAVRRMGFWARVFKRWPL